jgi:hypothetical protein
MIEREPAFPSGQNRQDVPQEVHDADRESRADHDLWVADEDILSAYDLPYVDED